MIVRNSFGITAPIIREGDNLLEIITASCNPYIQENDIIGITESVVARSQGNYITLDEITKEIKSLNKDNLPIRILYPIYSRNRFAIILKAIARATDTIELILPSKDEVGNVLKNHPFTGLNYEDYYRQICKDAGCKTTIVNYLPYNLKGYFNIDCSVHPKTERSENWITLKHICSDKTEYGLLGSNKATEEKLKLFPNTIKAQELVNSIQDYYKNIGIHVECMIYGDGCFKDPIGGIWEFADPVTSPAYTSGLEGTPNEIKIKAFADDQFANLAGKDLENAIKTEIQKKDNNLIGNMSSQGTTPRRKIDLLASLMDLTSGSGDAGTPIVIVRNYNKNYSDV